MKDIPIFTTPTGTASLVLREIPYQKTAYVFVRSVLPGGMEPLLTDCRQFCTQAGAERIYATAEGPLALPHDHDMLELSRPKAGLPVLDQPLALSPVTRENASVYQSIYNRVFTGLPNAAACQGDELTRVLTSGRAYLGLLDGSPAGVGEIDGSELRTVGVLPEYRGLGRRLTLTLLSALEGPELYLRAASTNERAMRLYDRLGFRTRQVLSRWYLLKG